MTVPNVMLCAMSLIFNNKDNSHLGSILSLSMDADELVIASPFCFADFSFFATEVSKAGPINKITLITTLKNEEAYTKVPSLVSFRNEMEKAGIQWRVLIDESLHGKVYVFKKDAKPITAIITSANLTNNGMRTNHEWGYRIVDRNEIASIERQILSDATFELLADVIEELNKRVTKNHKTFVNNPATIEIDDILIRTTVPKGKRIFVKPVGTLSTPVYDGDFSNEGRQFFSRYPKAVRVGDILITYGVGSRKIISAFEVLSEAISTENPSDRWKWYVKVKNLTPNMGKVWMDRNLFIMSIANSYYKTYTSKLTANGNANLNGLKIGNDKIQLTYGFGRFLYSKVVAEDSL